ncbi:MAG: hypothetical protein OEV23_04730 [Gallionella sp.]|nr:hypothetical protein [Gallionella sp.]
MKKINSDRLLAIGYDGCARLHGALIKKGGIKIRGSVSFSLNKRPAKQQCNPKSGGNLRCPTK